MSERTVRNWMKQAGKKEGVPRMGRPPHSKSARFKALLKVARVMRNCNSRITYREAENLLKEQIPVRLIRESLSKLRQHYDRKKSRALKVCRKSVRVRKKGVIVAQDGTHLGRSKRKLGIEAQVQRDAATLEIKSITLSPAAREDDILQQLKSGEQPLVWQTDNAKTYCSGKVKSFLRRHKIIHLVSRPGKPTDNPIIERGMREIKRLSGLGKGKLIFSLQEAAHSLQRTMSFLNTQKIRPSRAHQTSEVYRKSLSHWSESVSRDEFYDSTQKILESRHRKDETLSEWRAWERQVIYSQLELFGLVNITRGGDASAP